MQEIVEQVWSAVRGVWRYRWYIHMVAWPVCLAGWLFVSQIPDQYESKARVFVDTTSTLAPVLSGIVSLQSGADRNLEILTRTLLSRPNLEKIIRMTDMDLGIVGSGQKEAMISRLSKTIKFSTGRGKDPLYSIKYTDYDPVLAKKVVESLITIFVESALGGSRKGADSAKKFVDSQIKEYEQRLVDAENRLKEFKRENAGRMPSNGSDYFRRVASAKNKLRQVQLELKEAQNLKSELTRQLGGEEPVFGIIPSAGSIGATPHALDSRIISLQSRLDELLLRYTDQHPDVIATQETLQRLETTREKDLKELNANTPSFAQPNRLNQNPVYQQMKINLNQAKAKIASLQPRVDEYKAKVAELEKLIDIIPQIEADFKSLNRDYSVTKKKYEALLSRREATDLAVKAESSGQDDVKFRVIDPPRVPTSPTGPKRPLLETVVLIGGIIAGIAFAFFLTQIKPSFDTPKRLQTVTGRPVLGYISRVWTPLEKRNRKKNIIYFSAVGLLLIGLYSGLIMLEVLNIDVMASMKGMM